MVALLLALGALVLAAAPGLGSALEWRADRVGTEPWRLFSAAWVHLSGLHLTANLAGLALVAALGVRAQVPPAFGIAWLAAWPATHAALLLQPGLARYAGLSGVLHAGVCVAAVCLLTRREGRALGLALLAGVAVKLMLETPWRAPVQHVSGWDIPVAPIAHVAGAASGVLAGVLAGVLVARHERPSSPRPHA